MGIKHVIPRNGIYYYERRIPKAVKDRPADWQQFFKGQIAHRVSLETRDPITAMRKAADEEQQFDELVRLIVHGETPTDMPALVSTCRIRVPTPSDLLELAAKLRRRRIAPWYQQALKANIDPNAAEEFDRVSDNYLEDAQHFLNSLSPRYRKLTEEDDIPPIEWAEEINEKEGFNLPHDSLEFAALVGTVRDALLQAHNDIMELISNHGVIPPEATVPLLRKAEMLGKAKQMDSPTISAAIEYYKSQGGVRGHFPYKTRSAIDNTLKLFVEFVGDKRLHEISLDDIREFVVQRCEKTVGERSADSVSRPIAKDTVQRDLTFLRSAISLAISRGHFKGINPVGAINLDHFVQPRDAKRMPDKRAMHTDELQALLAHPWYSGCKSEKEVYQPGGHKLDDVRFWGTMVALFTGCRASELGGMRLDEVRMDSTFPHFVVRPNEFSNVKNRKERLVPILDELMKIGFAEYVEKVRIGAGPNARLFPDWKAPRPVPGQTLEDDDEWAKARWCVAFNRTVIPQALKAFLIEGARRPITFHQLRGTFKTMLIINRVPSHFADYMIGHTPTKLDKRYMGKIPLEELYPAVQSATYRHIDFQQFYRGKTLNNEV